MTTPSTTTATSAAPERVLVEPTEAGLAYGRDVRAAPSAVLAREYLDLMVDMFDLMLPTAAAQQRAVAVELHARGFTHIDHPWGPIEICSIYLLEVRYE